MLPIMVVFFGILAFYHNKNEKHLNIIFALLAFGAIVLGILRYVTEKPFPTAFFLLQLVGLIGLFWKKHDVLPLKHIAVFEIILVIAASLSYGEKVIRYFVAYNIGGLLFGLFMQKNLSFKVFDNFGSLGFTFFLGADIPALVLNQLHICALSEVNPYFRFVIIFSFTLILSYIITRWIETPLLLWGKRIETKLI